MAKYTIKRKILPDGTVWYDAYEKRWLFEYPFLFVGGYTPEECEKDLREFLDKRKANENNFYQPDYKKTIEIK
jgi:hypothetical protein